MSTAIIIIIKIFILIIILGNLGRTESSSIVFSAEYSALFSFFLSFFMCACVCVGGFFVVNIQFFHRAGPEITGKYINKEMVELVIYAHPTDQIASTT